METWICPPSCLWNLFSDELCWVSFADEDLQQAQFGFDVLVLAVLRRQWGAVLLLHVSMGTRSQMVRQVATRTVQLHRRKWRLVNFPRKSSTGRLPNLFFLPSVLSEELVLELFQVLAESLLVLSRLLELLHQLLPVKKRPKQDWKPLSGT